MWPQAPATFIGVIEALAFFFASFFMAGCGWYFGQRFASRPKA